jgi:hypothetical protein
LEAPFWQFEPHAQFFPQGILFFRQAHLKDVQPVVLHLHETGGGDGGALPAIDAPGGGVAVAGAAAASPVVMAANFDEAGNRAGEGGAVSAAAGTRGWVSKTVAFESKTKAHASAAALSRFV